MASPRKFLIPGYIPPRPSPRLPFSNTAALSPPSPHSDNSLKNANSSSPKKPILLSERFSRIRTPTACCAPNLNKTRLNAKSGNGALSRDPTLNGHANIPAPSCSKNSISQAPMDSKQTLISTNSASISATPLRLNGPNDQPLAYTTRSGRMTQAPPVFGEPSPANRHKRPSTFPLSYTKSTVADARPPPYFSYNLQATYHIDGGSRISGKSKAGSCAFLKTTTRQSSVRASKLTEATNNVAEFTALEEALIDAVRNGLTVILVVTDSKMVFDFLIDAIDVYPTHLKQLIAKIKTLLTQITSLYASKVLAHRKDSIIGNQVADALCTWALNTDRESSLHLQLKHHTLANRLLSLNRNSTRLTSSSSCDICLKENDHTHDNCPLLKFQHEAKDQANCCLACLSHDHAAATCPLYRHPTSTPILAFSKTATPVVRNMNLKDIGTIDFENLNFPNKQSGEQFDDYFETVFSTMFFAEDTERQQAAEKAIFHWSRNYRVDGSFIRRIRPRPPASHMKDTINQNPEPAENSSEARARKAASLGVDARVSDVTKALRSSPPLELTEGIKCELQALYPSPQNDETKFEPAPLQEFSVSRHKVAKYIMSRSRRSHPGMLGLTFGILQLMCNRWYKTETHDNPDPRWSLFCELIAKIMSGRMTLMSPMLHTIFGFFFDKNFEKPGASPSIRNIGVEETLFRIPAALVFQHTVQDAIDRGFITDFDFGAGKKSGTEIFAKIAEMAATSGCIITVMDVKKAFNNLRRKDIKAAVAEFNNPLLTAFVHFMFERDPSIVFSNSLTKEKFICTLRTGILQGNPLSVFIFTLTIAYILRPLRERYSTCDTIISSYVDDMNFITNSKHMERYPDMIFDFFSTFNDHGLQFDFDDNAKTSAFSITPLPAHIQQRLNTIGLKCQSHGIAPCKCPFGTSSYVDSFVEKLKCKLTARHQAFKTLLPAMIKFDARRSKPILRTYEHFLNLVRLSFLSMPMYTLRALHPSQCEPYTRAATNLANDLIDMVFPQLSMPPQHPNPSELNFPNIDMLNISRSIMQLPLSRGGLSLRLPSSIDKIAYTASCIDCSHALEFAASAISVPFTLTKFGEYRIASNWLNRNIATITSATFVEAYQCVGIQSAQTSQQLLTSLLNDHEIARIARLLSPVPSYYFAFIARTDKTQEHASWPFNPKIRANYSIAPLHDSEFSRGIQLAVLRPTFYQTGWCASCNEPIDTVGLHLLKCPLANYTGMHDAVKLAIAAKLRSLMSAQVAAVSVLTEKPVNLFYQLTDPLRPEGVVRKADIVLLLPGTCQQDIFIVDVVSVICKTPNGPDGFYHDLNCAEANKRYKYAKYRMPRHHFFPLAFGRTNVLSRDSFRFCQMVGNYFPTHLHVADRLRATISRAIVNGVAASLNSAVRRVQLAVANQVAFSMIAPVPDLARRASSLSLRTLTRLHAPLSQMSVHSLGARLAGVLTGAPLADDASSSASLTQPSELRCSAP